MLIIKSLYDPVGRRLLRPEHRRRHQEVPERSAQGVRRGFQGKEVSVESFLASNQSRDFINHFTLSGVLIICTGTVYCTDYRLPQ